MLAVAESAVRKACSAAWSRRLAGGRRSWRRPLAVLVVVGVPVGMAALLALPSPAPSRRREGRFRAAEAKARAASHFAAKAGWAARRLVKVERL